MIRAIWLGKPLIPSPPVPLFRCTLHLCWRWYINGSCFNSKTTRLEAARSTDQKVSVAAIWSATWQASRNGQDNCRHKTAAGEKSFSQEKECRTFPFLGSSDCEKHFHLYPGRMTMTSLSPTCPPWHEIVLVNVCKHGFLLGNGKGRELFCSAAAQF